MTTGEPPPRAETGNPPAAATTEPLLRVVAGNPTDAEAAALAVVLTAKLAARPPGNARPLRQTAGRWADRARALRAPLTPGPGAWRNSARP